MHDTAYEIGRSFIQTYRAEGGGQIVEIGSLDVNGTLKDHVTGEASYLGLDVEHGRNVDLVIDPRKALPLRDSFADLLISSSQVEHDPMFWNTFLEFVRVTKPGGYIYINTPSNGDYHRYPVDCWRFYPDAGQALVQWARHSGYPCTLIESFTAHRRADIWNDYVAIFQKCETADARVPGFLSDGLGADNIRKLGHEGVLQATNLTEDVRLADAARTRSAQIAEECQNLKAAKDAAEAEASELRRRVEALIRDNERLAGALQASRTAEQILPADKVPPFEVAMAS